MPRGAPFPSRRASRRQRSRRSRPASRARSSCCTGSRAAARPRSTCKPSPTPWIGASRHWSWCPRSPSRRRPSRAFGRASAIGSRSCTAPSARASASTSGSACATATPRSASARARPSLPRSRGSASSSSTRSTRARTSRTTRRATTPATWPCSGRPSRARGWCSAAPPRRSSRTAAPSWATIAS
ncbi:hypothetical protein D3C86_1396000 [compost metagenome]